MRRESEAQSLGGLEVDDELEIHWLLDGQVGRLGAFQDSVHVVGAALKRFGEPRPVCHEASLPGKHPEFVHRGEPMLGRKIQHLAAMIEGQHLCDHKERIGALPSEGRERRLEIERIAQLYRLKPHAQYPGRRFNLAEAGHHAGVSRIPEHGHTFKLRHRLFEELQSFRAQINRHVADTGEVAARPCQAGDQPGTDRIRHIHHYDRDRLGRILCGEGCRCAYGDDQVDWETGQFRRQIGKTFGPSLGIAPFNRQVLAFRVSKITKSLQEEVEVGRGWVAAWRQHANPEGFRLWLSVDSGDWWSGRGGERWPHHIHVVLFKKCFDLLHDCSRKILKKPLESSWVHSSQKHTRLSADVLKGMYNIFGYENERASWFTRKAATELEVELSAHDIKKLILRAMDVQGRSTR